MISLLIGIAVILGLAVVASKFSLRGNLYSSSSEGSPEQREDALEVLRQIEGSQYYR